MASTGRGKATTWQQRSAILEWLEVPANFKLITGGTQPGPVVAGKKLKKTDAYNQLAAYVNEKLEYSDPEIKWDVRVAKIRYESLLKTYKTTRDKYLDPGGKKFALTDSEVAQGKTIDTKLNELCPFYQRWDNLYGGRQNVNPSSTLEVGLDSDDDFTNAGESKEDDFEGDTNGDEEMVHLSLMGNEIDSGDEIDRIIPPSAESLDPKIPSRPPSRKSSSSVYEGPPIRYSGHSRFEFTTEDSLLK